MKNKIAILIVGSIGVLSPLVGIGINRAIDASEGESAAIACFVLLVLLACSAAIGLIFNEDK